ncbi:MAG: AAA family ATPase [Phormidesmis sp.]
MQILSVTLNNFKTHKDKQFEFQPGTNAICGENGAGKTSILEAIAWVLFNYQGSYRKEDLIRNGASSAQARVAFISSRDSRTYEVQRSTSQGYLLFDPQLNERLPYTRTKDEVLPWLRQHLGVSPGTDLGQLFANTIGVPQGTFTADFLLPTEKRKPIFDTVLKVEEYRETYKQSNSLRRYSEAQSQRLKDLIEQYEESLQSWDGLQENHQKLAADIKTNEDQLAAFDKQSQQLDKQRKAVQAQAEKVRTAQMQKQALIGQISAQQAAQARIADALTKAQQAADICQQHQSAYDQFIAAEAQIQLLSERNQERQTLVSQQQALQQTLTKSQGDVSRLEAQIEQFTVAEQALDSLSQDVAQQLQLEAEQAQLQQRAQQFANMHFQQKNLTEQLKSIEREKAQVGKELARLEALQATIEKIPGWEQQQTRLQEQLSRIEAAQQFEQEIQALAEKGRGKQDAYRQQVADTLKTLERWTTEFAGIDQAAIVPIREALFQGGIISKETLSGLNDILADLSGQTDRAQLQLQQKELQSQLKAAYAKKGQIMSVSAQQKKQQQLEQQQQQLKKTLRDLDNQLAEESKITASLAKLSDQLQQLNNPKGRQQLLRKTLQQQASVTKQHTALMAAQADSRQKEAAIAQNLKAFEALDGELKVQQTAKQTHQAGYLLHLQNQQAAQQVDSITAETKVAAQALAKLQIESKALDAQIKTLTAEFDPEAFAELDQQFDDIKSQADQLRGSLPQQRQRFTELETQIKGLKATAQKRDQAKTELKKRDHIKRFINYARKVYKAAGPRITERYVHNISREADRLFRDLLNRQNVALTWSADYEITVQEGPHTRRFINLSGGEQMCAALAVRLALLKVLADIDIAFFDEPTTNMDKPRRVGLAEAISRIKSFNQLFVISHDDTFEQVTETVITVTRDNE